MASEPSFDIVSQFDLQEVRNAVDQVKREISTRYDFKGLQVEVQLNEDDITVLVPDTMKLKAVQDMLFQKLVNRKLSPKILEPKDPEPAAGGTLRQVIRLLKSLDTEKCKLVSQMIKEHFAKVKSTIQGNVVRVSSKSKDNLQEVITFFRSNEQVGVPLQFINFRD